ncbi:MAG: hypothetical protein ABJD13_01840 [Paracoccaceae bacterium]
MSGFTGLSPDIYRKNAFRLLGLPTTAKLKQIKRRAALMVSQIESEETEALAEYVISHISPLPDEPEIREASHRLEAPQERMLDELFWFREGVEANDLTSVGIRNQVVKWLEEEAAQDDRSIPATQNLVVFYHIIALQIEAAITSDIPDTDPLLKDYHAEADQIWRKVFLKWRKLDRTDEFNKWLKSRFEVVTRDRLKEDDFADLKNQLLLGPLSQVLMMAFNYGRNERLGETDRLRRTALKCGVSETILSETAASLLQPTADQLLNSIETAQTDIASDAEVAATKATELLDRSVPDLKAMIELVGSDHHFVASIGDALASAANRAQIEISDTLQDHKSSRDILLRGMPFAKSPELIPILEKNLAFLTCQFCKDAARDDEKSFPFEISKITSFDPNSGEYFFDQGTVNVPRCASCARKNRNSHRDAKAFLPLKERLDQGWLEKRKPDESDLTVFLERYG